MTEKLRVIKKARNLGENTSNRPQNDAELLLAAEKMTRALEQRLEKRAKGELSPEDDIEVIYEWQ